VDGAAEVGPTPRHVSGGMFSYSPGVRLWPPAAL